MIVWQGKDTLTYRVQRAEQQERQAEQQGRQAEQQVLRAEQQVQVVRAEELAGLALEVAYFVHNIVVAGKKVAGKEMVADLVVRKVAAHRAVERRVAAHKAVVRGVAAHTDHIVVVCLVVHHMVAFHRAVDQTFRPLAVVRIFHPFQRCHQVSSQGRMVKQQTLCN